ncbi:hypothetical protein [Methylobacterium sp. B4]|uniref:hypothetical protein n=1 Tax=Methylobacterium sp. B4 TaxID=1938755 RepID=UPI000D75BBFF|nr:hypothetical protein [Methylobacterium sp. B4]PXW54466.1 hypothetical protein BY998_12159 [Methylobacterium sp. B4]
MMADDALAFLAEAFGEISDAERQALRDATPCAIAALDPAGTARFAARGVAQIERVSAQQAERSVSQAAWA